MRLQTAQLHLAGDGDRGHGGVLSPPTRHQHHLLPQHRWVDTVGRYLDNITNCGITSDPVEDRRTPEEREDSVSSDGGDGTQSLLREKGRRAVHLLHRDFRAAYSQPYVLKWSLWWALGMCGNFQVGGGVVMVLSLLFMYIFSAGW